MEGDVRPQQASGMTSRREIGAGGRGFHSRITWCARTVLEDAQQVRLTAPAQPVAGDDGRSTSRSRSGETDARRVSGNGVPRVYREEVQALGGFVGPPS